MARRPFRTCPPSGPPVRTGRWLRPRGNCGRKVPKPADSRNSV
ncbi:hypothetical protein MBEBAB_1548 [Brevundimonas abyssalis TAR-001]|uniref:Uncharacterized protein n=1 Tax=Brevundimonas abyssalis TAR-001 TaxID=1391729 RepID=A0A8E0KJM9_9CAUL|nr:hypothetical protein MBEBAB_1548 [Brevundimonas abyssalis TAR-001]